MLSRKERHHRTFLQRETPYALLAFKRDSLQRRGQNKVDFKFVSLLALSLKRFEIPTLLFTQRV